MPSFSRLRSVCDHELVDHGVIPRRSSPNRNSRSWFLRNFLIFHGKSLCLQQTTEKNIRYHQTRKTSQWIREFFSVFFLDTTASERHNNTTKVNEKRRLGFPVDLENIDFRRSFYAWALWFVQQNIYAKLKHYSSSILKIDFWGTN